MYQSSDVIWTLIAAFLVFFMQAGFALCESGLTRAKNTGNILMKNMMDFCIGTPCFWLVGFGLMFFGTGPLVGGFDPLIRGDYSFLGNGLPLWVFAIFQTVFCATAATIVSGSMAERTNFSAYCLYSAAISLIVYPISGHWIWGGGWLSNLGFHDFAGSTAVHYVGGVTAVLGAALLGPRIGKYGKDGKPRAILGHNLSSMALGVFILWFCWFGFNGGSTISMTGDSTIISAGLICFNTNLAAALATVTALVISWIRYKKPDVSITFNAALAGLVAITAGCDVVTPVWASRKAPARNIAALSWTPPCCQKLRWKWLSVKFRSRRSLTQPSRFCIPVTSVMARFLSTVWNVLSKSVQAKKTAPHFRMWNNPESSPTAQTEGVAKLGSATPSPFY